MLLAGVLISPAKGETVKAELSADFQENDQEYYDVDRTENYPSTATVAYGGTAIIGDAPDTNDTSDTENLTEDDDDTIDTSDDPYAGFVFPDSDTTIITKTQMKAHSRPEAFAGGRLMRFMHVTATSSPNRKIPIISINMTGTGICRKKPI